KHAKTSALYITPGSPWENGYIESYHARLRDEVLAREEFGSLLEAQVMLDDWREEDNERRPHGALGWQTPAAFAARLRGEPVSATRSQARHEDEESQVCVAR